VAGRRQEVTDLKLVLTHEAGVHEVLEVGKAFLDSEADGAHGHAVGQEDVPDVTGLSTTAHRLYSM
jgi:hypothetical protein